MLTWLALVVLVPVVLVPIVLLFGFAGCDLVFKLELPPPPVREKAFEVTLTGEQGRANRTIVQRIEPVRLFKSGGRVLITIQRPSDGDLILQSFFISQAADVGDPYDSAPDLTAVIAEPLLVSADPGNGLVELAPITYALDHTRPLLLAFDIGGEGRVRFAPNAGADATAFTGPGPSPVVHEAAIADRQSGYQPNDRIFLVQRIDVLV